MADWRSEYPFASHHLTVAEGVRLHYVDEGPRTDHAVLLLHGNPTWSFYYRHVIAAIREDVRCVAPDHVGMGLSDKPSRYDYTLARRIDDIARLIDHLGLKRVHLVVHDWGGAIGFGLATRRPDLIGRIVVLNTAAFPDVRIPFRIAVCRWPVLGALLVRGLNGFAGTAVKMAVEKPLSPAARAGLLAPYDSWGHRVAVHAFVRDIPMAPEHPSFAELQRIETNLPWLRAKPMLFAWGLRDWCFSEHFLERFRCLFPAAGVIRYPAAGHYVLEDARDEVVPAIVRFLGDAR